MGQQQVGILIADDHPVVRKWLRKAFEKNFQPTFFHEVDNGRELIESVKKKRPDIAIVDLEMPELNGYDSILRLHTEYPSIKIVVFSGFLTGANQDRAIKNGAFATISKSENTSDIMAAFKQIIDGEKYHSAPILCATDRLYTDKSLSVLTEREKQILKMISLGKTSKQISEILNISQWTVDKHRANIKEKLGLKNIAEMVRYTINKSEN
jgi:DNA-binding NarL/FixJ family response regulator